MQYVVWFRELANLRASWAADLKYGELYVGGFPVPSGFVVIPEAREFISRATEVADVSQLSPSSIPDALRKKIVDCYFSLDAGIDYDALTADAKALVNAGRRASLVRVKSKTKEFANIKGSGIVLEAVLRCLAAGGPVVIQKVIRAEKAGTARSRGDRITVNSTYGELKHLLNKDTFYVSKCDGRVQDKRRGSKEFALIVGSGGVEKRISVPAEKRGSYSLHQKELEIVYKLATRVEQKYPGKTAYWGISGRKVYLLGLSDKEPEIKTAQPAPTTAFAPNYGAPERRSAFEERRTPSVDIFNPEPAKPKEDSFFSDFGGLAGTSASPAPSVQDNSSWQSPAPSSPFADTTTSRQSESQNPFAETAPSVPKVSTDSSPFGDIFSSDFGTDTKPESNRLDTARDYAPGNEGSVFAPVPPKKEEGAFGTSGDFFSSTPSFESSKSPDSTDIFSTGFEETKPENNSNVFLSPSASPKIGVFVDNPASAEQALIHNPDLAFLNMESFLLTQSPSYASPQSLFEGVARNVFSALKVFSAKDVSIVLSDLGGERASLLGRRGIRRIDSQALDMEFTAIGKAINEMQRSGLVTGKINVLLPFVTNISEVKKAEDLIIKHGLRGKVDLGVVIETPAAVSIIGKLCERCGFVAVNVDTLTQYMLAVDRKDEAVKHLYDYGHDAVSNALRDVAKACKQRSVPVYAYGDALGDREIIKLIKEQEFGGVVASQNSFSSVKSSMSGTENSKSNWGDTTSSSYW